METYILIHITDCILNEPFPRISYSALSFVEITTMLQKGIRRCYHIVRFYMTCDNHLYDIFQYSAISIHTSFKLLLYFWFESKLIVPKLKTLNKR